MSHASLFQTPFVGAYCNRRDKSENNTAQSSQLRVCSRLSRIAWRRDYPKISGLEDSRSRFSDGDVSHYVCDRGAAFPLFAATALETGVHKMQAKAKDRYRLMKWIYEVSRSQRRCICQHF